MNKQHTCPLIIEGTPQSDNVQKLEKVTLGLGLKIKKINYMMKIGYKI